jgi:hypothetical protein
MLSALMKTYWTSSSSVGSIRFLKIVKFPRLLIGLNHLARLLSETAIALRRRTQPDIEPLMLRYESASAGRAPFSLAPSRYGQVCYVHRKLRLRLCVIFGLRHHIQQHPPHPPRSPNKLSKSGQRLGVNGWNFSEDLLVSFRVMLEVAEAA